MKSNRPRSAKVRTLPPDITSLTTMFRSVHADLIKRAEHLKSEPHDFNTRKGFQQLHDQRSDVWIMINQLNPQAAQVLASEYNLAVSQ